MGEPLPELIGKLEPGAPADQFVRAAHLALVRLAELLEATSWDASNTARLEEKLDGLSKELDTTNELLHNMIQVLSSRS